VSELEQFQNVVHHRHEYAKQWKREKGALVFGFFGDYVPEEIPYAAGILPVKMFGCQKATYIADAHISPEKWCFFCRDCFAEGLSGRYDYLDGLVITVSCFHLQQSFDSWVLHLPISFHHCLDMPFYVQGDLAKECFLKETERFVDSLEQFIGKVISSDALERAIRIYNKNRHLMRSIYNSMKANAPLLSGSQAMEMVLASTLMDKVEHNNLLEALLIKGAPKDRDNATGPRLMIIGAETDDTETVKLIEALGARVVADLHSSGTRYFWNDVSLNGDLVSSIAARYVDKIPLPQMDFPDDMSASHALKIAIDFKVQGAIILLMPHCDPFQWDIPVLTKKFQENNIPIMVLDLDPVTITAMTRTRVEAFIEMLNAEG
jgi:benzoyl-CoA reductase subunit C